MNLLIVFLLTIFTGAVITADRPQARPGPVVVLTLCVLVSAAYLVRRFV